MYIQYEKLFFEQSDKFFNKKLLTKTPFSPLIGHLVELLEKTVKLRRHSISSEMVVWGYNCFKNKMNNNVIMASLAIELQNVGLETLRAAAAPYVNKDGSLNYLCQQRLSHLGHKFDETSTLLLATLAYIMEVGILSELKLADETKLKGLLLDIENNFCIYYTLAAEELLNGKKALKPKQHASLCTTNMIKYKIFYPLCLGALLAKAKKEDYEKVFLEYTKCITTLYTKGVTPSIQKVKQSIDGAKFKKDAKEFLLCALQDFKNESEHGKNRLLH